MKRAVAEGTVFMKQPVRNTTILIVGFMLVSFQQINR